MSYPTQEDELRAKEAVAVGSEVNEEKRFLSTFSEVPTKNAARLQELSRTVVDNFNMVMNNSRQEPFERQENLMTGMKKLFEEEIRVIEARLGYTRKINPSTAENG